MITATRRAARVLAATYLFGGLLGAGAAEAQTASSGQTNRPPRSMVWEIEGYGGGTLGGFSLGGASALPAPGETILTASFMFPSRQTSSWFFGDGASMLNSASAELDLTTAISPLDDALRSGGLSGRQAHGGVRIRRTLTPRYALEFGLDVGRSPRDLSGDLNDAITVARDTFESAFAGLLASGPFTGVVVDATQATTRGSGREISATAAVNIAFRPRGRFVPYATIGGGVLSLPGGLPSASLEGDYRASVLNDVPIHETDRVTIRVASASGTSPLVVLGGGVRRDRSERWGWRIDGRLLVSTGTRVLLDATPLVASGSPAGFIESLTNPDLQFSNNASTGRVSTLGGQLSSFEAFHETVKMRAIVTVGIVRRF